MGPFKCPDCGVWWAGFEHRCAPTQGVLQINPPWTSGTSTVRCTCPPNRSPYWKGTCPIHDVHVTYGSTTQRPGLDLTGYNS